MEQDFSLSFSCQLYKLSLTVKTDDVTCGSRDLVLNGWLWMATVGDAWVAKG